MCRYVKAARLPLSFPTTGCGLVSQTAPNSQPNTGKNNECMQWVHANMQCMRSTKAWESVFPPAVGNPNKERGALIVIHLHRNWWWKSLKPTNKGVHIRFRGPIFQKISNKGGGREGGFWILHWILPYHYGSLGYILSWRSPSQTIRTHNHGLL